jgi:hypothetical protein
MSPMLDQSEIGSHLTRAPQRIGCEHPVPINLTVMADPSATYLCLGCRAAWCTYPATRRPLGFWR